MTLRYWTEEETQYLLDYCGLLSNKQIAHQLGRTCHAIRQRLSIHKVSVFSNIYTARLVAKELGRDKSTVMQWYRKGWLKGRVADFGRGYLHSPMIFTEEDIVVFLKKFHYRFNYREIPNPYFKNVVEKEGLPKMNS